ncbi:DnaJ subfamily C member 7 [Balamuthia mandrillaris]
MERKLLRKSAEGVKTVAKEENKKERRKSKTAKDADTLPSSSASSSATALVIEEPNDPRRRGEHLSPNNSNAKKRRSFFIRRKDVSLGETNDSLTTTNVTQHDKDSSSSINTASTTTPQSKKTGSSNTTKSQLSSGGTLRRKWRERMSGWGKKPDDENEALQGGRNEGEEEGKGGASPSGLRRRSFDGTWLQVPPPLLEEEEEEGEENEGAEEGGENGATTTSPTRGRKTHAEAMRKRSKTPRGQRSHAYLRLQLSSDSLLGSEAEEETTATPKEPQTSESEQQQPQKPKARPRHDSSPPLLLSALSPRKDGTTTTTTTEKEKEKDKPSSASEQARSDEDAKAVKELPRDSNEPDKKDGQEDDKKDFFRTFSVSNIKQRISDWRSPKDAPPTSEESNATNVSSPSPSSTTTLKDKEAKSQAMAIKRKSSSGVRPGHRKSATTTVSSKTLIQLHSQTLSTNNDAEAFSSSTSSSPSGSPPTSVLSSSPSSDIDPNSSLLHRFSSNNTVKRLSTPAKKLLGRNTLRKKGRANKDSKGATLQSAFASPSATSSSSVSFAEREEGESFSSSEGEHHFGIHPTKREGQGEDEVLRQRRRSSKYEQKVMERDREMMECLTEPELCHKMISSQFKDKNGCFEEEEETEDESADQEEKISEKEAQAKRDDKTRAKENKEKRKSVKERIDEWYDLVKGEQNLSSLLEAEEGLEGANWNKRTRRLSQYSSQFVKMKMNMFELWEMPSTKGADSEEDETSSSEKENHGFCINIRVRDGEKEANVAIRKNNRTLQQLWTQLLKCEFPSLLCVADEKQKEKEGQGRASTALTQILWEGGLTTERETEDEKANRGHTLPLTFMAQFPSAFTDETYRLCLTLSPGQQERGDSIREFLSNGNESYQHKDYSSALQFYTLAIHTDPSVPYLYSRRAAAYGKLRMHERALSDAEKVVAMAPTWSQGYVRRALALMQLGRWSLALKDCKVALKLGAPTQLLVIEDSIERLMASGLSSANTESM